MKRFIRNELLLIIICSIAAFFGPIIWINAQIQALFLLVGLVYSIVCLIASSLVRIFDVIVLERLHDNSKWLWGTAIGFTPFFLLVFNRGDYQVLFEFHRSAALLNMPIILLMLIVLVIYLKIEGLTLRWSIYKSGVGFTLPLFLILLLIPKIPSSEGKVFLGNIAIIYFFIKTVLTNKSVISKE